MQAFYPQLYKKKKLLCSFLPNHCPYPYLFTCPQYFFQKYDHKYVLPKFKRYYHRSGSAGGIKAEVDFYGDVILGDLD